MLKHLSIRNFILIDSLDLDLTSGFYVITGETGSGKSILLEAIFFCLGGKYDAQVVRHGEDSCSVTIEFALPEALRSKLLASGIDVADNVLIVKRQQSATGRKKFFVNDQMVTHRFVEEIADHLIEIHGQHGVGTLLRVSSHLEILDRYGDVLAHRSEVAEAYEKWKSLQKEVELVNREQNLIEREIDYLEFVVKELEKLDPREGEEAHLVEQRLRLQQQEKHTKIVSEVLAALQEPAISTQLSTARKLIYRQIKDESFKDIAETLDQMLMLVEEVTSSLERKLPGNEPLNIDEVEERLFAIRALARKHQVTADELPKFFATSHDKLDELKGRIENKNRLSAQVEAAKAQYSSLAATLTSKRQAIAQDLENKVNRELAHLRMGGAFLKVEFTCRGLDHAVASGLDSVRFVGCTNPGTPLAPIDKIASGGELARFMLALKVVLFDKFIKPTIIFDEIDTGIGGVVADAVGERLKSLGTVAQVIAITHQPQVAGKGYRHICVSKQSSNGTTTSKATLLQGAARIEEIARMISGRQITRDSRKAAATLIA